MSLEGETNKFMPGQAVRLKYRERVDTKDCEHCGSEIDVYEDRVMEAKVSTVLGHYYPKDGGGVRVVYIYGLDNGASVHEADLEAV